MKALFAVALVLVVVIEVGVPVVDRLLAVAAVVAQVIP
jgi:hypothetical protein